ncbi:MAG: hypothetical protein ACP5JP_00535 [bacterium]
MYREAMEQFLALSSGVTGTIFVDSEGESVDQAGSIEEYELKVIGAHSSIFFNRINNFTQQPDAVLITMGPHVLGMYRLSKDYFLLVLYVSTYHALINRFRVQELIKFIKSTL